MVQRTRKGRRVEMFLRESGKCVWRMPPQLKVMELEEALESSGSYSKQEIMKRANKFREKLLLVSYQYSR